MHYLNDQCGLITIDYMFENQKNNRVDNKHKRGHITTFTASLYDYMVTTGRAPRECGMHKHGKNYYNFVENTDTLTLIFLKIKKNLQKAYKINL